MSGGITIGTRCLASPRPHISRLRVSPRRQRSPTLWKSCSGATPTKQRVTHMTEGTALADADASPADIRRRRLPEVCREGSRVTGSNPIRARTIAII